MRPDNFSIHSSIIYTETQKFGVAGVSRQNFNFEVNAKDYGFEPTNTPRTDRLVKFPSSFVFSFLFLYGLSSDLTFDGYTFTDAFPIINSVVFYPLTCYYVNWSFGQLRERDWFYECRRKILQLDEARHVI